MDCSLTMTGTTVGSSLSNYTVYGTPMYNATVVIQKDPLGVWTATMSGVHSAVENLIPMKYVTSCSSSSACSTAMQFDYEGNAMKVNGSLAYLPFYKQMSFF